MSEWDAFWSWVQTWDWREIALYIITGTILVLLAESILDNLGNDD